MCLKLRASKPLAKQIRYATVIILVQNPPLLINLITEGVQSLSLNQSKTLILNYFYRQFAWFVCFTLVIIQFKFTLIKGGQSQETDLLLLKTMSDCTCNEIKVKQLFVAWVDDDIYCDESHTEKSYFLENHWSSFIRMRIFICVGLLVAR